MGGLAGYLFWDSWDSRSISNSYAVGDVTGQSEVGGLAGKIDGVTITNSYRYDNQTITLPEDLSPNTSGSVVGLALLKAPSWYTGTDAGNLGWYSSLWRIGGLVNSTPAYHPHIFQSGTTMEIPNQPNIPLPTP